MKLGFGQCIVLAASLLLMSSARAVPAPPFPLKLQDHRGVQFAARMHGDENLAWFEDMEGFAISRDAEGAWRYAERASDGRLAPGPFLVGESSPTLLGLQPHLRPGAFQVERAVSMRAGIQPHRAVPPRGTIPNLVILVKFKNQTPTWSPQDFEPVFNGEYGSVRHYYREVSYGKLNLVSTITDWIELPESDEYYAYNDAHPYGRPAQMVRDAVAILNQRGFDFARFDADQDGEIDAIDIIHSGPSFETTGNPSYIHSHYAPLAWTSLVTRDGISITAYHTESEFGPDNSNITQIGVIAHETAHFFGLPDLYDYGYDSAGLGLWCLMSAGSWGGPGGNGRSPSHPSAWAKLKLGFVEPTRIVTDTPEVVLQPSENEPVAVLLDDGMPNRQFFMLENRRRTGFDAFLPGEGLLIFHVDESRSGNSDQERYLVDLEQADGKRDLNLRPYGNGDSTDPFPLPRNSEFTPTSTPGSVGYGASNGSIFVTGIARNEEGISFSVSLRDPAALGGRCDSGFTCESGHCADGVCCQSACDSPCYACSREAGAPDDGLCSPTEGRACDDGNPCTLDDLCQQGVCRGGVLKECNPIDSCHGPGECQPDTGRCTAPRLADGVACDDGNPCTLNDSCSSGFCRGTQQTCAPQGACELSASCDPAVSRCLATAAPNGADCPEGACSDGVCKPKSLAQRCGCSATGAAPPGLALTLLAVAVARIRRRLPSPTSNAQ